MNRSLRRGFALSAMVGLCLTAAACGFNKASGSDSKPSDVQIVVDTGPGGGSDLFAREMTKIAKDDNILSSTWPVLAKTEGGGLGAMAFMKQEDGKNNYIAAFTSKWIVAGLDDTSAPANLDDLTPLVALADETQVIAAPASAPYDTMAGFVDAAKAKPGELVQTGGSVDSVDNLIALQIEKSTGTSWKYLSFDDGAPRITAMLRGDAQIDIGAVTDFADQIAAGKLKLIGVVGDQRLPAYPKVSTLAQQGLDLGQLPAHLQFRGIAGPPNMPQATKDYYLGVFKKITETDDWKKYLASQGLSPLYVTGGDLTTLISQFTTSVKPLVANLPASGS
jgi:putative tricarboxylic transport membrane protein